MYQILALCDVESKRLNIAKRLVEKAYTERLGAGAYKGIDIYGDFRQIAARNDIDAVMIATPDHRHTLVSLAMLKAGKDVYCEKPLTLTINEGKMLVKRPAVAGACSRPEASSNPRDVSASRANWFETAASARSTRSTSASAAPRRIAPCRPNPFRKVSTGTCGSARPRGGPIIRSLPHRCKKGGSTIGTSSTG